ncbi:sensor histidine kinase [Paenibacillus daejeonensis]|uniref:sensor histidine kinase n=1 Tax=Paenibacillus daejeonensis TaxID=135193 RepID=UPI001FDF2911|nr:sensor histidine kinase [Paenibacillus daejeonensis]
MCQLLSVKAKLAFILSSIVFILLILNVLLHDYMTRDDLRAQAEQDMSTVAEQLMLSIVSYRHGVAYIDREWEERLRLASIAAADRLGPSREQITASQLNEMAHELGLKQVVVLSREQLTPEPVLTSDTELPNLNSARWRERMSWLASVMNDNPSGYWSPPYETMATGGINPDKWGYYTREGLDYMLAVSLDNTNLTDAVSVVGPAPVYAKAIESIDALVEIMLFNMTPEDETDHLETTMRQLDKMWFTQYGNSRVFGTGTYAEPGRDYERAQVAMKQGILYHEAVLGGKELLKSYVPFTDGSPYILGIVMDKQLAIYDKVRAERDQRLLVSSIAWLIVIIFSYWISGWILRPIRSILWKVSEVASGRFDESLLVTRKDEFGQLATRINAMSKNLAIYTTKLKQAFEENRSMKEYLESFINHTIDAIHVVDLDGRVTQVNRAFEKMFGWTAEEAVGHVLPLIPASQQKEEQAAMEALRSGKLLDAREVIRRNKYGEEIAVSVTTSPIRDRSGAIGAIASISRDMTSRNKMEELLRQSEKLTTVGQLAAGVAHEIRNPLTTLRGFLQLQQQTGNLNMRHNDLMLSELDRINLIVSEFLILAKPQASKFHVKDVRYVLGDVISLLDSQAHLCNVVFQERFSEEPCEISCEENQLKQVFINLLKNAMESMPQGGEIIISVTRNALDYITIAIQDQGIGIPEEMIPKLGDPFFTGKETGTGLGIMVSQRIIHSHHGTMQIASTVGEGTTVKLTLPAWRANAGEASENEVQ